MQAYLTLRVLRNALDGVDIDTGIGTADDAGNVLSDEVFYYDEASRSYYALNVAVTAENYESFLDSTVTYEPVSNQLDATAHPTKNVWLNIYNSADNFLGSTYQPLLQKYLAVRIKRELDLAVDSILISGGLGVSYRASDNAPDLTAVSERVRRSYETLLTPAGLTPKLILAEGRLMAAKAGVLVSRVLAVKRQQTPLVILDADCAQLLREIAFGASHRTTNLYL